MHRVLLTTTLCLVGLAGQVHAQGFTPQELDRMSQERNNALPHRDPGPRPPRGSEPKETYRPVQGLWVCMSTDQYIPILAAPRANAPQIGISSGRVAAGANQGDWTSVLFREGAVGYVPKSAVRPYQNEFNPRATCTIVGFRGNGVVVFSER